MPDYRQIINEYEDNDSLENIKEIEDNEEVENDDYGEDLESTVDIRDLPVKGYILLDRGRFYRDKIVDTAEYRGKEYNVYLECPVNFKQIGMIITDDREIVYIGKSVNYIDLAVTIFSFVFVGLLYVLSKFFF